ncbi:hypothetical protein EVAR_55412_1 [Eumeta japonica]|uniref:Uncharacterized protein n=1 Tax=Eumeta variegata TaxID=151549 RepID=A0A4C1YTM3_EUMVA|nr:hypothetical protein EVAR_55412_1 [Eumeta japonica]
MQTIGGWMSLYTLKSTVRRTSLEVLRECNGDSVSHARAPPAPHRRAPPRHAFKTSCFPSSKTILLKTMCELREP